MKVYDAIIQKQPDLAPVLPCEKLNQVNGYWLWKDGSPRDKCPSDKQVAEIVAHFKPMGVPLMVDAEALLGVPAEWAKCVKAFCDGLGADKVIPYIQGGFDYGRQQNFTSALESLRRLLPVAKACNELRPMAVAVEIHAETDTELTAYIHRMQTRLGVVTDLIEVPILALVRPDRHPSNEILGVEWWLAQRDLAMARCKAGMAVWSYREPGGKALPGGDWVHVLGKEPLR